MGNKRDREKKKYEVLHTVSCSPDTIRVVRPKRIRWIGEVVPYIVEIRNA
jgi:hypothetical protein